MNNLCTYREAHRDRHKLLVTVRHGVSYEVQSQNVPDLLTVAQTFASKGLAVFSQPVCLLRVYFLFPATRWLGSRVVSVLDLGAVGRVQIAVATLSGNSLRQTVHTRRASVHQAAKL